MTKITLQVPANIVKKEDEILGNQETSDGGIAEDNEEVLEVFKGTASRENDDQDSRGIETDDQPSFGESEDSFVNEGRNLENVIKEEKHDYHETSGKESVNLFNIVWKEEKILVSQETSDGGAAEDGEEVLEDFKGTTSRENDDQGSQSKENDDKRSLDKENDDQKNSIDETDDHSNTDEEVPVNDEEQTDDKDFIYVGANYDLKEGNEDGKLYKTLKVMYEDLDDAFEVSEEDDGACSKENEIKGEHASPDVNIDETLEDEESSHEGTENEQVLNDYEVSTARETDDQPSFDENEKHVGKKGNLENDVEAPVCVSAPLTGHGRGLHVHRQQLHGVHGESGQG